MAASDGDPAPRLPTRLEAVCDGLIEAGWLLALVVTPVFFNPHGAVSFDPDKAAVLQCIVVLMAAAWLVKVAAGGRAWRPVAVRQAEGKPDSWPGTVAAIPLVVPAALIGASTVAASLLSVDPHLSWLGSHHRAQGASTEIAYLVVFALTLGHFRTRTQWRRAAFAIILSSVPVALYGLAQHLGLDPIEWAAERVRVGSTFGNPIFLGAYLVFAFFVTIGELTERIAGLVTPRPTPSPEAGSTHSRQVLQSGVLLCLLALQSVAMVLSGSRGPVLGLLAGGYTFLLVGLLAARRAVTGTPGRPSWLRAVLARAWLVVLGGGLAVVGLLAAVNLPASPVAGLRELPYVGRLGTAFDLESRTARVRQLIWQGSLDLLSSREPLRTPAGTPDGLHRWRPLIGHGPETFALAFGRFHPPELARIERRDAIPDRAHNDTFQLLVVQGALGWMAWTAFFCLVFYYTLSWLGFIASARRRLGFWAAVVGGAAAGAAAPVAITGSAVLSGVGLSAGLMLGLLCFVTVSALLGGASELIGFREVLILTVLAAVAGHYVELTFGIAITTTRVLLWFLAAVLVVAGEVWMPGTEAPSGRSRGGRGPDRGSRGRPAPTDGLTARWSGVAAGLLTGAILVASSYALLTNPAGAGRAGSVAARALFGADSGSGVFWMLLATWLAAAALAPSAGSAAAPGPRRPGAVAFIAASLLPWTAYTVIQASRLAGDRRLQTAGHELVQVIEHASLHVVVLGLALLLLAVALGAAIAAPVSTGPTRRRRALLGTLSAVVGGVVVVAAAAAILRPSRADAFLKNGNALAAAGRPRPAIELLERAAELDPAEPSHQLSLGTTAVAAAQSAAGPDDRAGLFAVAETAFVHARALAPLDPDHTQNLARLWVVQAQAAGDAERRTALLARAEREYAAALEMRPYSQQLVLEYVGVLEALGETDRVPELVERAVGLDPADVTASLKLASLRRRQADRARAAGDRQQEIRLLDDAIEVIGRAYAADPGSEAVALALAAMYARAGRIEDALAAYQAVLDRFGEDSRAHRVMALLELSAGRPELALGHAERSLALATPQEQAEAMQVMRQVRRVLPTANREPPPS